MTTSAPDPDPQPSLFEGLPATEPKRRRPRRPPPAAPETAAPPPAAESAPPPGPPAPPYPPVPDAPPAPYRGLSEPARLEPASLSRPDLSDLIAALPDQSLGFVLVEAVREAKRRLSPEEFPEDEAEAAAPQPSPLLLRALKSALMDLTESD